MLDSLYRAAVLSRWAAWQDFRVRHPRTWSVLYPVYQAYRHARRLEHHRIQKRFRDFTMLSPGGYRDNLALCETVRHLPGTVVECGTWKGGMCAGIATLLGGERSYYLFDSFEGLPPAGPQDRNQWGQSGSDWQAKTTHNDRAAESFAHEAMRLSGARRVHITKGWFADTLATYPGEPIAILRCDADWYSSTMDILTNLYRYVVPSGIIILDDYYYWEGCAKAVHTFLAQSDARERVSQSRGGYAYLIKR